MGMFALVHRTKSEDSGTTLADIKDVFKKRGFSKLDDIAAGPYQLLIAPKTVSPTAYLYQTIDGDFAASTGTFFYAGLYGHEALARLLQDWQAGTFDEDACIGCFAAIVFSRGVVAVFSDALGTYKIYETADQTVISSSFLACVVATPAPTLDPQSVYEYVFQGAAYGGASLVKGISQPDPRFIHQYRSEDQSAVQRQPRSLALSLTVKDAPLADHVAAVLAPLRQQYAAIAKGFGNTIDTALSGGYDSRLTLALLREQGVVPHVHVYGSDTDPDVVVAKTIAKSEGFALTHDNKARIGAITPDSVAAATVDQFWAFDGVPPDGVIGHGSDIATRKSRTANGILALNGGGGEVFRNFFYLPNHKFSTRDVLWTFYSQFDPETATDRFRETAFHDAMAAKIAATFAAPHHQLTRTEVEFIYPGFRGRFWTGTNTAMNNVFGPALTPFFDFATVRAAVQAPLGYKNHGVLEAAMIAAVDPRLAGYSSAYGHNFIAAPPLSRRVKDWATYWRPPLLRRYSYRLKTRLKPGAVAAILKDDFRQAYLPGSDVLMARYFRMDRIHDSEQVNRILTLELLCRTLNVDAG